MKIGYWIMLIIVGFCLVFLVISDPPLEDKLRHVYLLSTRGSHYWKNTFKHPDNFLYSYLFPSHDTILQKIEEGDHNEQDLREKGGGEKVKEAVEKSLGRTKSTVEESAKSAAEIAGDTVHKVVDTVKDTINHRIPMTNHPKDEL